MSYINLSAICRLVFAYTVLLLLLKVEQK